MSKEGLCFDVGNSGNCCDNCYKCSEKYSDGLITDEEIIRNLGLDEQERMFREYEEY